MKKVLLILTGLVLSLTYLNAQVLYSDDFETYTVGNGIAAEENNWWNTWSGTPGSSEDPKVSDAQAFSGTKSIKVINGNDGVIDFDGITEGRYRVEFYLYVPSGRQAYWNIMQNFNPSGSGLIWGLQVFLKNGNISIDGNGEAAVTYPYTPGEWMKIQHFIDLNSDWVDFYINGELVHAYQWSKGTFGTNGVNKLDAFDFYGWDEGGTCEYYMDNFLIEEVETPYPPTNFSYTLENSNDVVLTWDAPTEGNPINYSIARNGSIIGTTTETTLTDLNVYPGTNNYSLLAFYGESSGYSAALNLEVNIEGGNERNFVVYEMFTGTWCGYCPIPAQAIAQIEASGKKVAVMKYHGSGISEDIFETPATAIRQNYYGSIIEPITSYPASVINGTQYLSGAAQTVAAHKEYFEYYYDEFIDIPAVYTLELETELISNEPYKAKLIVNAEETLGYFDDEMRLMLVLTESDISYSWQGQSKVNNAVRNVYPNANGTIIFDSGTTYNNEFEISLPSNYVIDNCEIIAFIQRRSTGEIQQANKIDLPLSTNIQNNTVKDITIYPNPANDIININSENQIQSIEILNISGQVVNYENISSNKAEININNLSSGVYFVKIYTENSISTQKLIIE